MYMNRPATLRTQIIKTITIAPLKLFLIFLFIGITRLISKRRTAATTKISKMMISDIKFQFYFKLICP
jgi:hypothetical protein